MGRLVAKGKLLSGSGANPKLIDFLCAKDLAYAADDSGMRIFFAQILVSQVSMGVKVDNVQVRISFNISRCDRQRDQVLSPQSKNLFPCPQMLRNFYVHSLAQD
jgi:hypothetical protein